MKRERSAYYYPAVKLYFALSHPKRRKSSLTVDFVDGSERAGQIVVLRDVTTKFWSQGLQKMLDDSEESMQINEQLRLIHLQVGNAIILMKAASQTVTPKAVKAAFLQLSGRKKPNLEAEKPTPKRPTFEDCFSAFYTTKANQKRKPVSDRTKESYFRYKKNLTKYLTATKGKKLYADQINHEWANRYLDWLLGEKEFVEEYADNNIKMIKAVLQHSENVGMIERSGLKGFRFFGSKRLDTTHLTMDEVKRIAEFDFSAMPISPQTAKILREEADVLIFTCFTGQHHSDLLHRDYQLYTHPTDGRTWIRGRRGKTKQLYNLPLDPLALAIIHKYGGVSSLPVVNNAERNIRLKQIAAFCGIQKHLTTKIGRKTLASYALNDKKVRQETVAKMLGHTSAKFVRHYATITEESIANEYQF